MIGIQVGAVSFLDEGVPQVLDAFQQRASINTLFVATFTYAALHLAAPPYSLSPAAIGTMFAAYLVGVVLTPALCWAYPAQQTMDSE
jgi:hypothetical protein